MICDSYFQAIKGATPSRIEAIDMARRGLHNEGSEKLARGARGQGRDRPRHRPAPVHAGLRPAHPWLMPTSCRAACCSPAPRTRSARPWPRALMKYLHGRRVFVQSAGVRAERDRPVRGRGDGRDRHRHRRATAPRSFEELEDDYFDLVISLSPEAQHRAVELTRTSYCELEFWRHARPEPGRGLAARSGSTPTALARPPAAPPPPALPAARRPGRGVRG